MNIEERVKAATAGDKAALADVVSAIQDQVYGLSLRMLVNPEDAIDATQEILIKVITNLSSFRFKSQFKTWVYRIAANQLITEKKIRERDPGLTFEFYRQDLENDLQAPEAWQDDPQYQVLLNELRISCTMAMLLCLNLPHRMAYILGDIFEMDHAEASEVLSISKSNFRKRLSRARQEVFRFTQQSCGLVSEQAACSCERKLTGAVVKNRVTPGKIYFAGEARFTYEQIKESLYKTQKQLRTLALQQSVNSSKCPISLSDDIESLIVQGIKTLKTSQ